MPCTVRCRPVPSGSSCSPAPASPRRAACRRSGPPTDCGRATGSRTSRRRRRTPPTPPSSRPSTTPAAPSSADVEPNPAHLALARLEAAYGDDLLVVTQNVDDLHERAGSTRVVHMHGELLSAWCTDCDVRHRWSASLLDGPACPGCGAAALRPDIVWFGEMPYRMDEIEAALIGADLFVSIGTSGAVYPAAGFVQLAGRLRRPDPRAQPRPVRGHGVLPRGPPRPRLPASSPPGSTTCSPERAVLDTSTAKVAPNSARRIPCLLR